jgi:hypothetical protein
MARHSKSLHDPEAAWVRKSKASRRVGIDAKCACGESRPEALLANTKPRMCHECQRREEGKTIMDEHHAFGKSNSPITVSVPANDHRADLSVAQYEWPRKTVENPDGSPLLAAAGTIRGFIDYIHYLIEKGLTWVVRMLELADELLRSSLGPKWWVGTELEQFVPKQ